jgi:MYXO-CTERM domain-containing protein
MAMTHRTCFALTLGVLSLHATAAWACSYVPPTPIVHIVNEGTFPAASPLLVDTSMGLSIRGRAVLRDAQGDEVLIDSPREQTYYASNDGELALRYWYEFDTPLSAGEYTLDVYSRDEDDSSIQASATFTVTDGEPPDVLPQPPTLSWRAVLFDGPEDAQATRYYEAPCGEDEYDSRVARYLFEASADSQGLPGFITLTLDAGAVAFEPMSDYASVDPTLRIERDFLDGAPHIQCVEATFTDIYGRTSEPTRSCIPDGCEARNRNDRAGVNWANVDGCSDWSPGYAERNAPGCAQAQGAPASAPWALALGLLGLVALRRRL